MPHVWLKGREWAGRNMRPGDLFPKGDRPKRSLVTGKVIAWISKGVEVDRLPITLTEDQRTKIQAEILAADPNPLTQRVGDRSIDHTLEPDPTYKPPPPPVRIPPKVEAPEEKSPSPFVVAPTPEEVAAKEKEWLAEKEEERAAELEMEEDEPVSFSEDTTRPDGELSAMIASQDRFEAEKFGESADAEDEAPTPDPDSGVEQLAACVAHTHEDTGSSPVPATTESKPAFVDRMRDAVKPKSRKSKGKKKPRGKKRG